MMQAAEQGGLPLAIAVNLIGQACEGLQAAHDTRDENGTLLGVVHRDVSPQNLLVSFSGTAKLVDFGIAKVTAKSSGLTQAGEVKGKFAYMAPEQVRGQAIDARTDLFSLGILLYAITTGKHPFRGAHLSETLQNICSATPAPPPSSFLPDYPNELEAVVLKALAKQPEDRFATAPEMLAALHQALPSALAPGFDSQVAEVLQGMFGAQAKERRNAIRKAQHELDRLRGETSASSVGTLRAISISNEGGEFSVAPTPIPSSDPSEPSLRPPFARRWRVAATVIGGALLALGTAVQLARSPAAAGSAAASSPVPHDTATFGVSPPVAAAAPAASTLPTAAPSGEPGETEQAPRKSQRGKRAATPIRSQPSLPVAPAPVVAPAPASPPVSQPASSKPAAPASGSANAWDRGAFGGRH
jgi:serine/threonine-protein kinase